MTGTGGAERQGFRFQVLGGIGARHTAKGTQGAREGKGSKGTHAPPHRLCFLTIRYAHWQPDRQDCTCPSPQRSYRNCAAV